MVCFLAAFGDEIFKYSCYSLITCCMIFGSIGEEVSHSNWKNVLVIDGLP